MAKKWKVKKFAGNNERAMSPHVLPRVLLRTLNAVHALALGKNHSPSVAAAIVDVSGDTPRGHQVTSLLQTLNPTAIEPPALRD